MEIKSYNDIKNLKLKKYAYKISLEIEDQIHENCFLSNINNDEYYFMTENKKSNVFKDEVSFQKAIRGLKISLIKI